jgi:hypothetical protein
LGATVLRRTLLQMLPAMQMRSLEKLRQQQLPRATTLLLRLLQMQTLPIRSQQVQMPLHPCPQTLLLRLQPMLLL